MGSSGLSMGHWPHSWVIWKFFLKLPGGTPMNVVPVNFALTGATGIRGGGRTPSNRIATNTAMCWRLRGLYSAPPFSPTNPTGGPPGSPVSRPGLGPPHDHPHGLLGDGPDVLASSPWRSSRHGYHPVPGPRGRHHPERPESSRRCGPRRVHPRRRSLALVHVRAPLERRWRAHDAEPHRQSPRSLARHVGPPGHAAVLRRGWLRQPDVTAPPVALAGRVRRINLVLVFAFAHQLGYFWRDGRGAHLATPFLRRVLARARVWKVVVLANVGAMTIFTWHMTALVLFLAIWSGMGRELLTEPTAAWWLSRPIWILGPGTVLATIVLVGRRVAPRSIGIPVLSEGSSSSPCSRTACTSR